MNKNQLLDTVAAKTGLKKKDVEAMISAFVDTITETLTAGESVHVAGIGTFDVKVRPARSGRNPKTQENISIPASKYPIYSASKTLKDAINK